MMKRNHSSDSSSEDDDTSRFEEAALSPEFILKSSQIPSVNKPSKGNETLFSLLKNKQYHDYLKT